MKRLLRAIAVAGIATGVALSASGCLIRSEGGPKEPIVSTGGPATTPPAPTTPAAEALAPTGIGPYQVGAKLAALKSASVLANLDETPECQGWAIAQGIAPYGDAVSIIFYQGAVNWVQLSQPSVSTVEGAKVGMTLDEVKSIYGSKATPIDDGLGGKALSVRGAGGLGLFFRFSAGGRVTTIEAGNSETLEFRFTDGEGC